MLQKGADSVEIGRVAEYITKIMKLAKETELSRNKLKLDFKK